MKSKKGIVILAAGLLCLAAALALFIFNRSQSNNAQAVSDRVTAALSEQIEAAAESGAAEAFPTDNADRQMPRLTVEDEGYVGILAIPALGLELPVAAAYDEAAMQLTPCLYSGSVYRDDMVIGAHNYDVHFGGIGSLSLGDEVVFTDTENHRHAYQVVSIETLRPDQHDELVQKQREGDWDLTLFTCNYSGNARIVVRCAKK